MLGPKIGTVMAVLLVATVLQTTLITSLIQGAHPDFILAITSSVGLVAGPWAGAIVGLIGGAMTDMLTGRLLGLVMLTTALAGAVSGTLAGRLFRENAFVPFVVGAATTVVHQLLFLWGARAFGVIIPFEDSFTHVMLPSMWYNGLLTALSFPLVYRLNHKLNFSEQIRR